MLLREEIESDLSRMEFELRVEEDTEAQTFEWKGAQVPCCPSNERRETLIDANGNPIETTLRLLVRRSHFKTADSSLITVDSDLVTMDNDTPTPVTGRTLVFRGRDWRVLSAREGSCQSFYVLDLADLDSNR